MNRVHQRGQAAVETVGIAVMVALLLAAVSAWLVREVRLPDRPPAVIEAVSRPLERLPGRFEFTYPLTYRYPLPSGGDAPIGRVLRAIGRGTRDGIVLSAEARNRFALGFGRRLRERAMELLHDPLGGLTEIDVRAMIDDDLFTPSGLLRRSLRHADTLWEYAQELRSMPLREAALKASEDAGRLAADGVIEAGRAALKRRIARTLRRPPESPDPPRPDRPDGR